MRATSLLVVGAALLLAGCATIPEGAPTAMVRFTSNVNNLHMSTRCGPHASAVKPGTMVHFMSEESPVRMIGTQPGKRNDVLERLIPAEEEIGFRLHGGTAGPGLNTTLSCTYYLTFIPRKDEQYHVHFELNTAAQVCTARLYRLSQKNGVIERTPIQAKRFKDDYLWPTVNGPCPATT